MGLSTRSGPLLIVWFGPPLWLVSCSDHLRACGSCGKAEGFSKLHWESSCLGFSMQRQLPELLSKVVFDD